MVIILSPMAPFCFFFWGGRGGWNSYFIHRYLYHSQRALRPKKFNPDRKFQSWLEIFNPRSKLSISTENFNPRVSFTGPSWCTEKGRSKISIPDRSLEILNPKGCDRFFQSQCPLGSFFSGVSFLCTASFLHELAEKESCVPNSKIHCGLSIHYAYFRSGPGKPSQRKLSS